jgi:hypothetical protein
MDGVYRHRETQTIPSQAAIANELSMFGRRNSLENSEGGFHMKNQRNPRNVGAVIHAVESTGKNGYTVNAMRMGQKCACLVRSGI